MSCKLCSKMGNRVMADHYDELWLENGDILMFDNSGDETTYGGVKINYCPFCGRKLNEES